MHNVVASHYWHELGYEQGVIISLAELPDSHSGILAAQPSHEWCLSAVEDAHVHLIAHCAQPRHEVHHQGLGATREQRGYHMQYFHLFCLCFAGTGLVPAHEQRSIDDLQWLVHFICVMHCHRAHASSSPGGGANANAGPHAAPLTWPCDNARTARS